MAEIDAFPIPVVAAIHGACLGGGLELALACHSRICTHDDKTMLGLPEVQLGLLPGSGGTQRLPRLVGVSTALEMILTGKQLRARQALKGGLVDDVVPQSILLEAAVELALKQGVGNISASPCRLAGSRAHRPAGQNAAVQHGGQKDVDERPKATTRRQSASCRWCETGLAQGSGSGYAAEARAFGELAMTPQSQALRSLFFASTALKKERGGNAQPHALHRVGILGGGLMGGGIAFVTATRKGKLPVRIKDINETGINHALQYSWQNRARQAGAQQAHALGRAAKTDGDDLRYNRLQRLCAAGSGD